MKRLHRNNAAEWLMVIVLTPVAWAVRLFGKLRTKPEPATKTRPPMIEGLPPRTYN